MKKLYILFALICIAWVISLLSVWLGFGGWTSTGGVFGDSFGAINSLFSGLALGGIIYTILLQKEELALQRKELKQTRKEFTIQNETLKKQRFENTFFHLVNLHNEIVDKLYITRTVEFERDGNHIEELVTFTKRDFFAGALDELRDNGNTDLTADYENDDDSWMAIQDGYGTFNFVYAAHLSHYFRNLYHIYKYIHLSNLISPEEKQFYATLIRAQLSDNELTLIFYNMLVKDLGYPKFKFLEQEYDILQNLVIESLFNGMTQYNFFRRKDVKENPFLKETSTYSV